MNNKANIRNFCLLAHVDHGKSTLADRLLEKTGTVSSRNFREQFLDQMELEREKGVTIKAKAVRLTYQLPADLQAIFHFQFSILNLIDTPGHVDFSYEVSRTLACCEGAVLLVDATTGIQAQTLAHFEKAAEHNLKIIPVINKIDLPAAEIEKTEKEIGEVLGFEKEEILKISAKTGEGVDGLLEAIIQKIPPPAGNPTAPCQALIFDSFYDSYRGVVALVRIFNGHILNGKKKILLIQAQTEVDLLEVGYLTPQPKPQKELSTGEVGYVVTDLKDLSLCRVGDTITFLENKAPSPWPGYKPVKSLVYLSFYPQEPGDFPLLSQALGKLKLNDASITFKPESSGVLGRGFRLGFLGLFHAEIIKERLEREYGLDLIATTPQIIYQQDEKFIENQQNFEPTKTTFEPWARVIIFTPQQFLGPVLKMCHQRRGLQKEISYLGQQVKLSFEFPLSEIIFGFDDDLKSLSSGFASFDLSAAKAGLDLSADGLEYRRADIVLLNILLNQQKIEAFSFLVLREKAYERGKKLVLKLKELIPRQQFEVAIQAAVGGKIIARETVPAMRKDVAAKLYGGDRTRKDKLLQKQRKGKKKMKTIGRINLPPEAFLATLKISS